MSIGVWAQVAIFTWVWVSRYETYRFPRVDGLSTDTSGFEASHMSCAKGSSDGNLSRNFSMHI